MSKILVIGETCDDIFIYGEVNRLNPEAPVPIITPKYQVTNKGMAENVYRNLESLGATVDLVCNSDNIKKIRYVDDSYNYILLRIDIGDDVNRINLEDLPNDEYSAVVIGDYNKGFLETSDIIKICKKYTCPIFLDTKKELGSWVNGVDYIKINNSEYQRNKKLIDDTLLSKTIVTRGKEGCNFNGNNYPTKSVEVKDVVGAGDTFLAGLVFKYIENNSIEESIEFANLCSTQVVQKRGVGIVDKNELYGKK
jgi:bifunctional ADP-heptose synthase (sugar kinase/adenylyltransferase)